MEICECGCSLEPGYEAEHQRTCFKHLQKLASELDDDAFTIKTIPFGSNYIYIVLV